MGLPISTVNLVLKTASASKTGFGVPLFQTPHMGTIGRVATYQTTTESDAVFSSDHPASLAAKGYKSSTPSVSKFKIGKVEASLVLTPEPILNGKVYSFVVGNATETGTCTYTATTGDTEEDVVDNLLADIATFTTIASEVTATKVGVGALATLELVATGSFIINKVSGLVEQYTATESYEDSLSAIRAEDDDFWFFNSSARVVSDQTALASAIQATSKSYFTASSDAASIAAGYTVASTDLGAVLKTNNYSRVTALWGAIVNTYPECTYVGVNAPFSPDERSVVWDGRELIEVPVATNTIGNELTSTQRGYLDSRNMSYVATTSVGPRILGGKMAGGKWIDDIRTQDTIIARVSEALDTLILNQAGGKLVGGAAGIALADAAIVKALTPFIASEALESFKTDMSEATIDTGTRTLSNAKFEVVLAGAILRVIVNGTAVNQEV